MYQIHSFILLNVCFFVHLRKTKNIFILVRFCYLFYYSLTVFFLRYFQCRCYSFHPQCRSAFIKIYCCTHFLFILLFLLVYKYMNMDNVTLIKMLWVICCFFVIFCFSAVKIKINCRHCRHLLINKYRRRCTMTICILIWIQICMQVL